MHHWSGRTAATMTTWSMIQLGSLCSQSLFQFVQISVFCTFSLAIVPTCCNQLVSNLVNLEPQFRWDTSWSFCNNSMAACVQWAFQVSQGSVETLFRWGGKRSHDFAAHLFRRQCTKFHQNCARFIGDVAKTFWTLLLWTHCSSIYCSCSSCCSCCCCHSLSHIVIVNVLVLLLLLLLLLMLMLVLLLAAVVVVVVIVIIVIVIVVV